MGQGWARQRPEEALLEGREATCLADEDISNLAHLDADEEHSVAGVLLVQALSECLWAGEKKQPESKTGTAAIQVLGARSHEPLNALSPASEPRGKQGWRDAGSGQVCRTPHCETQTPWSSRAWMSVCGQRTGQANCFQNERRDVEYPG